MMTQKFILAACVLVAVLASAQASNKCNGKQLFEYRPSTLPKACKCGKKDTVKWVYKNSCWECKCREKGKDDNRRRRSPATTKAARTTAAPTAAPTTAAPAAPTAAPTTAAPTAAPTTAAPTAAPTTAAPTAAPTTAAPAAPTAAPRTRAPRTRAPRTYPATTPAAEEPTTEEEECQTVFGGNAILISDGLTEEQQEALQAFADALAEADVGLIGVGNIQDFEDITDDAIATQTEAEIHDAFEEGCKCLEEVEEEEEEEEERPRSGSREHSIAATTGAATAGTSAGLIAGVVLVALVALVAVVIVGKKVSASKRKAAGANIQMEWEL